MTLSILLLGSLLQASSANVNISAPHDDSTDMTKSLNAMIAAKTGCVYCGGKGVMLRNLNDGFSKDTSKKVVPGSLLTNDIITATIAYPAGNPMCPNDGWTGYNKQGGGCMGTDDFLNPVVLAAMGTKGLKQLFENFDTIQSDGWGYGVFFGTDSNSADQRCFWAKDSNGWDCPSYWINQDGSSSYSPSKTGAGGYPWGNPGAGLSSGGGGGAGCHFNPGGHSIDQFDSSESDRNLVGNSWCECNYALKGNYWGDWVDEWINHAKPKDQYSWMKWLGGNPGKAPSWALDLAMCWVNNPRDMIQMQNAVWNRRMQWSNQLIPKTNWDGQHDASSQRNYWGWNEVPIDREKSDDTNNWDSLVIKLPAAICKGQTGGSDSINCVGGSGQLSLEDQLGWYENNGYMKPGYSNIKNHPGSQVVFLREWQDQPGKWQRWFFCESFNYDRYKVVFKSGSPGQCYVDYGNGPKPAPSPPPTPAPTPPPPPSPPKPSGCTAPIGQFKLSVDQTKCLDITGGNDGPLKAGQKIEIWDCNNLQNQDWMWCSDGRIVARKDNTMCLDIPGGDPRTVDQLQIWDCNGMASQYWKYDPTYGSVYPAAANYQFCMDNAGGKTDRGTAVVNYNCQPGTGTWWITGSAPSPPGPSPPGPQPPSPSPTPAPRPVGQCVGNVGIFKLGSDPSKCLDVSGGQAQNGAKIDVWGCNGLDNQKWKWCSDGRIVSESGNEKYCLDVPGGDVYHTHTLQMWECNGHIAQYWSYDQTHLSIYTQAFPSEQACIDVKNNGHQQGDSVILYKCHPGTGMAWNTGTAEDLQPNATLSFIAV